MSVDLSETIEGAPVEDRAANRSTTEALPTAEDAAAVDRFLRELDEQIIPLGRNLFRQFNRMSQSVSASGLHLMKMITLLEKPTAKELAKNTLISDAATSQLLGPLMHDGFVSRERSKSDRRVFNLVLTEKGKKVIEENRLLRRQILAPHFSCLEPRERGELIRLLRKIRENSSTSG